VPLDVLILGWCLFDRKEKQLFFWGGGGGGSPLMFDGSQ